MPLHVSRRSLLLGAAGAAAAPLSTLLPGTAFAAGATAAAGGLSRENFTIVMLPDTQHSMKTYYESFTTQMDWIAANRDTSWKIRYTVHVGDIVHNGTDTTQWSRARSGFARLDGKVPYATAPGNHDYNDQTSRTLTNYNAYLPYSKFNTLQTAGGTPSGGYPSGRMDNNWHQFTAGGTDWGIISLAYDATATELAWARSVLAANPNLQFIVNTHSYLIAGSGQRGATGERIWNDFVKLYPNIFMVLCGHSYTGGPKRKYDIGVHGNRVEEILADYQTADDPMPNSYLRIMQFRPTTGTIAVRTYSPRYRTYLTDAQNSFDLTNIPFPQRAPQVKRHIIDTTVRSYWHLTAADHWWLAMADVDKYPTGSPINSKPVVLGASGNSALYVLDRGYKRHIVDIRSYKAWRFVDGDRRTVTADQLAAYPTGPTWPRYPHLIRGEGTAPVYILDAPL